MLVQVDTQHLRSSFVVRIGVSNVQTDLLRLGELRGEKVRPAAWHATGVDQCCHIHGPDRAFFHIGLFMRAAVTGVPAWLLPAWLYRTPSQSASTPRESVFSGERLSPGARNPLDQVGCCHTAQVCTTGSQQLVMSVMHTEYSSSWALVSTATLEVFSHTSCCQHLEVAVKHVCTMLMVLLYLAGDTITCLVDLDGQSTGHIAFGKNGRWLGAMQVMTQGTQPGYWPAGVGLLHGNRQQAASCLPGLCCSGPISLPSYTCIAWSSAQSLACQLRHSAEIPSCSCTCHLQQLPRPKGAHEALFPHILIRNARVEVDFHSDPPQALAGAMLTTGGPFQAWAVGALLWGVK
jgi:hypothetical protein